MRDRLPFPFNDCLLNLAKHDNANRIWLRLCDFAWYPNKPGWEPFPVCDMQVGHLLPDWFALGCNFELATMLIVTANTNLVIFKPILLSQNL